jgi:diacylglycerol kinase family enzyme
VIEKGNIRDADVGEVFFKPRPELEHLITDEERARAQAVRNTANDGMLDNTLQGEPLAHLYFINICNIGMAADVVYYMEKHSKLKRVVRSLIYGLEGLRANIPFYRLNRSHLSWTVDSEEPKKETKNIYFVSICNGQYFGGGMRVTPKAKLHNGRVSDDLIHNYILACSHCTPAITSRRQ